MRQMTEFTARLIRTGRTQLMSGEPGPWVVTPEAIREAIDGGLFRGLPCFVDHAPGHPAVRTLLGQWHDVVWDEAAGAAVGRLVAYDTDDTRPVLALVAQWLGTGEPRPPLGISLVHYPLVERDGQTIRGFAMVESADLVMYPASAGSEIVGMGERAGLDGRGAGSSFIHFQADKEKQMSSKTVKNHSHSEQVDGTNEEIMEGPQTLEEWTAARRVMMVAGPAETDPQPGPDGSGWRQASLGIQAGGYDPQTGDWLSAIEQAGAAAIISASGLPTPVQQRLRDGQYATPHEVHGAVDRARAELAALQEAGVVRLGGRPPRELSLRDPLDEARALVGFFFGAPGADTPPINMRSFADLYVALTGDVYFRGVFDGSRTAFSGATTSTLPNLAVDAMNRVIVEQFRALDHYRWYERVVSVEPNDGSLQAMKWITMGGLANLPSVSEGGAYTELSVSDLRESSSFVKRGGYVGITREMIRNSEIMQLQAIPRALAVAALRTRSAAVAALFTANNGVGPTLAQDNKALFHDDHGNLATTALGTDAAAWRAARAECFQSAEVGSGKALGVYPRYLLVPSELYDTALSILGYGEGMPTVYVPEAQARSFADPRPLPLAVPDWTDANNWAYLVDPAVYPVIHMSYSQAPGGRRHPIPELFAVVSETSGLMFSNDVLPVKVRDEFALGVNGYRGIGKRNVA